MNTRELVNHIRSGPAKLVLDEQLLFLPRTCFNGRCNPCELDEFLHALESSVTIQDVFCSSQQTLRNTEDEWVLLVQTLGRIRHIQNLSLLCRAGSRDFRPFQAFAEAVNNAQSLRQFSIVLHGEAFPRDSSGLTALANALREHTGLQEFRLIAHPQTFEDTSLDPVLRALPACPHLKTVTITTKNASADAVKTLLQLPKNTDLTLFHTNKEHWLAVADGIRQGQCNIKSLLLSRLSQNTSSETTEVVKAIASAIREDRNLEDISLHINYDITDEAGVVLAEALTVNKTLRKLTLSGSSQVNNNATFGALVYEAFSAMLRVNTSLVLKLPPFDDAAGDDQRLVDSRNQMRIEQGLNEAGRGRLLSLSQATQKEWVDALNEFNSSNMDETPEFNVSCLYSLLRLNPATCM
jgi:hypothetical protein